MNLRASTAGGAPREAVVLAWEPGGIANGSTWRAALEALAGVAARLDGAIWLPLDRLDGDELAHVIAVLQRCHVRALPAIELATDAAPAGRASLLATMLMALEHADALAQWDGIRYLAVDTDIEGSVSAEVAPLLSALGAPRLPVRVGWVRRRSLHLARPGGTDFAFDWAPCGTSTVAGAPLHDCDYTLLATGIARRDAAVPIALSVLWSPLSAVELPAAATRVTGISALKSGYAIDAARRFVRNRDGERVPFWVLRAAFDPGVPAQVRALATLSDGLAEPPAASGSHASAGRIELPARSRARIAVVVHLYYPELWGEFADALAVLPEPCDLFVSCPPRARDAVATMVRERHPGAVVFAVQNLGRDVLPFLLWLATPGVERYQYVLKFHSKKSEHLAATGSSPRAGGEEWRHQALDSLLGDGRHVAALLQTLDDRPEIGIVAPAGLLYDQVERICANADLLAWLCVMFATPGPVTGRFPAGTMFWARVAALAPLARAPAAALNFEREAGQVDATLHHGYERLFPWIAAAQGFRTVDADELLEGAATPARV